MPIEQKRATSTLFVQRGEDSPMEQRDAGSSLLFSGENSHVSSLLNLPLVPLFQCSE